MLTLAEVFVGRDVRRQGERLPLVPGAGQSRVVGVVEPLEVLDRGRPRLVRLPGRVPSAIRAARQPQQLGADYGLLQAGIVSPVTA